jgi:hypothetical protein
VRAALKPLVIRAGGEGLAPFHQENGQTDGRKTDELIHPDRVLVGKDGTERLTDESDERRRNIVVRSRQDFRPGIVQFLQRETFLAPGINNIYNIHMTTRCTKWLMVYRYILHSFVLFCSRTFQFNMKK